MLGTWDLCLMVLFYGVLVVGEHTWRLKAPGDSISGLVYAFGLGSYTFMLQPESQSQWSSSLEVALEAPDWQCEVAQSLPRT